MTATRKKPLANSDLNGPSFNDTKGRAYHLATERFYLALALEVLKSRAVGKANEMALLAVKRTALRGVDTVARTEARAFCDRNGVAF
jgi:hypothetical protein